MRTKEANVGLITLTDIIKKYTARSLLPIVIIGGLAVGDSRKIYETNCEVYRGYNIQSDDGRIQYVFDLKHITKRGFRAPEYRIYGDRSFRDSLTMNEKYCFKTIKKGFFWSKRYIESITPCNPKNLKNR